MSKVDQPGLPDDPLEAASLLIKMQREVRDSVNPDDKSVLELLASLPAARREAIAVEIALLRDCGIAERSLLSDLEEL